MSEVDSVYYTLVPAHSFSGDQFLCSRFILFVHGMQTSQFQEYATVASQSQKHASRH